MRDMNYHRYNTVRRVVIDATNALDNGEQYDTERTTYTRPADQKIRKHSFEEHFLTKWIEDGA